MRKILVILLAAVILMVLVLPVEAGGCKKKARKAPEFKISLCRLLAPWPYKCRKCEDIDMDGVNDCIDKCLSTPKGAVVDADGCPVDSDGDGVYDGLDSCPDTPAGAKVDKSGCPIDSDGDGVYDGLDKCPRTPKGAVVDAAGCPVDSDKDGVYDGLDKCPDTPMDLAVDEDGCPIKMSEFETQFLDTGVITTTSIQFASGKSELKPESMAVIDEIAELLIKWPDLKIEIGGHTDSQGSEKFNQALSQKRAEAVRAYMVEKYPEMNPDNLTARGYGESDPVADNGTAEGRQQNRRVEFTVLNKETLKKEIEQKGYKKR